jgi:putative ABC transport system permease protein
MLITLMDVLLQDLRFVIRSLWRGRFVSVVIIVTLGLGIGVVTALFAVIDAVLLRPIVSSQDRVVRISKVDAQRGDFPFALSLPELALWREQSRNFETLAAVDHAATGKVAIAIGGRTSAVQLSPVSADFFRVIYRGEPLYGRWLTAADERHGAEVVAVVSERFWRRVSGGDPAFVGRRLSWAGNRSLLVVGIAPAAVDYPLGTDIWAPGATVFDGGPGRFDASKSNFFQFELIGRLAAGVSLEHARAELNVIHRRIAQALPNDYQQMRVVVVPLIDSVVGDSRTALLALFAAAGLVFVIAGVNVAALLLMRASGRTAEVTIRVALGAGHARLLRQTVTEAMVLGVLGAISGLAVARALLVVVQWLAPGNMPRIEHTDLDIGVLAFCGVAALSWVTALGTVPVWVHRRITATGRLEHSFRAARGTKGLLVFTAAEIAAAVVVAIGAGLLVRTFAHLQAIDRGFDSDNLLMVSFLLPEQRQRDPRAMLAFYDQLIPQVDALPGVVSASPVHAGPGTGTLGLSAPMLFEGQTAAQSQSNPWSTWEPVLPSYFRTLGIPIVRGREFTPADRRDGAPVAIVSESVARRYWPGLDPVGRRLRFVATAEWPWVTVVGVAADTRYRELTKSWMTVYFPADQFFYFRAASLIVRTPSPADALIPAILQRAQTIEPTATIESAAPMNTLLARELSRPLSALTVTGLFALMAMVMAAVGVYSVMSYEVRQRRRELAVRSAIGASPPDIFRSVIRRSLIVGAAGAAVGLVVAITTTRALRSLLFDVQPLDPEVFVAGAGVLLGVVLVAACFPARRAARTNPAAALRAD